MAATGMAIRMTMASTFAALSSASPLNIEACAVTGAKASSDNTHHTSRCQTLWIPSHRADRDDVRKCFGLSIGVLGILIGIDSDPVK